MGNVLFGLFAAVALAACADANSAIKGTTSVSKSSPWSVSPVVVSAFRLNGTSMGDRDFYESAAEARVVIPVVACAAAAADGEDFVVCPFSFTDLRPGNYSVFAWSYVTSDFAVHTERNVPIGWHSAEPSGAAVAVELSGTAGTAQVSVRMYGSNPWPKVPTSVANGRLFDFGGDGGIHVLRTWGEPYQQGYAHGSLIPSQVVDFFRFYLLERGTKSASKYESIVVPWLKKHIAVPEPLRLEIQGIVDGVNSALQRQSLDPIIPELGRPLRFEDVLAVNAYIEAGWPLKHPEKLEAGSKPACTQFVFWNSWTPGKFAVAGRNMDAEIDLRKVTNTHLLIRAIEPSTPNSRRIVSVMWPGFVGTLSGVDEDGNYIMENAGRLSRDYVSVTGDEVPSTWLIAEVLRSMPQAAFEDPEYAQKWMLDKFGGVAGGVSPAGSILVFATNSTGYIYECDRYGGAMRSANEASPFVPDVVFASNHFMKYGAGGSNPDGWNFGQQASFSSRWRYEAARNKVQAWREAQVAVDGGRMKELLQMVCEGETEHSVVWEPQRRLLSVAVATSLPVMWNAPYGKWVEMPFDALFV